MVQHGTRQSRSEVLTQQEVIEEAARRIFRSRLQPLLRSHGYDSPESLLGEVWEKACAMSPKFDSTKGSTPAAYLAVGAGRAIKKRLLTVGAGLDVPLERANESRATRALKQAARCAISLDNIAGGTDSVADMRPRLDEEGDGFDAGEGAMDSDERLDDCMSIEDSDDADADGVVDDEGRISLAHAIKAWAHCGNRVLEVLGLELARLQKPGAWARAVNRAAKQLACRDDDVRDAVATTLYTITLRSGNTHRETVRRVLDIDELLRRNGARGPYNKKSRTPA